MIEYLLDYLEPESKDDEFDHRVSVEITRHTDSKGGRAYFMEIEPGVDSQSIEITKRLKEKLTEALDKVDL